MSKLFKVFGNNDKYNYVEEKNLEKVNCKCGGKYFATDDESYVPLGEQNERNQPSI